MIKVRRDQNFSEKFSGGVLEHFATLFYEFAKDNLNGKKWEVRIEFPTKTSISLHFTEDGRDHGYDSDIMTQSEFVPSKIIKEFEAEVLEFEKRASA